MDQGNNARFGCVGVLNSVVLSIKMRLASAEVRVTSFARNVAALGMGLLHMSVGFRGLIVSIYIHIILIYSYIELSRLIHVINHWHTSASRPGK